MQGFESPGPNQNLQRRTEVCTSFQNMDTLAISNKVGVASASAAVVNVGEDAMKTASMEVVSSGGALGHDKHVHDSETAGPH